MAKIALSSGFTLIPEGTQIFKITDVSYKEQFGKMEVSLETADGMKHSEKFSFLNSNGSTNEGAMAAFSMMAKAAMNDYDLTEIDHKDLVGRFFEATVTHDELESTKTPGKMLKFVRLNDKSPSDGFAEAPKKASSAAPSTAKKGKVDLSKLLG